MPSLVPARPHPTDISGDQQRQLTNSLLRKVLLALAVFLVLGFGVDIPFFVVNRRLGSFFFLLMAVSMLLIPYMLFRRGLVKGAAWFLAASGTVLMTGFAFLDGGIRFSGVATQVGMAVVAVVLLGPAAIFLALGALLADLAMAGLEVAGFSWKFFPEPPIASSFVILVVFVTVLPLVDDAVRHLGKALETSQRHLREQQQALEQIAYQAQLIAQAADPVVATDNNHVVTSWNAAAAMLFGWSEREALGRSVDDVLRFSSAVSRQGSWEELAHSGSWVGELFMSTRSGEPIVVNASIARLRNAAGKPVGSVAWLRDITAQKRADEMLRKSEERFRELVESVEAIVWEADAATLRVTFASQGAEKILGYPPDQWTKTEGFWADHLHPHDRDRALACEREVLEKGKAHSMEHRMWAVDGRWVWFRDFMHAVPGPEGKPERLRAIMVDITETREAEEALRESEEMYRTLFDSISDAVVVHGIKEDCLGPFLQVNDAACQCLGYTREELLKLSPWEITAPERRLHLPKLTYRLIGGKTLLFESVHVSKDGRRVPVEIHIRPFRLRGTPLLLSIARDISERKRAEEALRESEARFSSLFENVTVGIYRTTPHGRILMANPALLRMLGFNSLQELASRNLELEGFAPGYPRSAFREEVEREGGVNGFESAWQKRDGTVVFVRESARAVRSGDGRALYYDGIVEDVTERRRADEALRQSEARFRAVFENAAIGIALVDMHGYPVESNPAVQKMLGYDKTELAEMVFTKFTHPDDVQASWDLFAELVEGKRDRYQLEKRYYRKDGRIVWGQLTESLVRNQNGNPEYAIAMVDDISERKQAEEQLRDLVGQLHALADRLQSAREEERTRLAREIHDELGQNLTAIKIDLNSIFRKLGQNAKSLSGAAESILNQVDQTIRTLRRIATELRPGILDDLGLAAAIEWATEEFQARTGIKCQVDLREERIVLDRERTTAIFRIFQETLTNVARHSGATELRVRLFRQNASTVLEVRDNGMGIQPQHLTSAASLGILGMRERALVLNGHFEIASCPEGGTKVSVRIPDLSSTVGV